MNEVIRSVKDDKVRALLEAALRAGWTARRTEGGHVAVTSPKGKMVVCALTPSDRRNAMNLRALLKRNGLDVRSTDA